MLALVECTFKINNNVLIRCSYSLVYCKYGFMEFCFIFLVAFNVRSGKKAYLTATSSQNVLFWLFD